MNNASRVCVERRSGGLCFYISISMGQEPLNREKGKRKVLLNALINHTEMMESIAVMAYLGSRIGSKGFETHTISYEFGARSLSRQ